MGREKNNTKKKIVTAAWRLFYKNGYDHTTVDAIIRESGTSKGTFYHYFNGKDGLLTSLSYLFDDKYEELLSQMEPEMNSFDKLLYLNRELFHMIETSVSRELLATLYSSQLITKGEKHLLDQNRIYYRMLNDIVAEGQQRGQIHADMAAHEIARTYALCERALLYDWCIHDGDYSLREYGEKMMKIFLGSFKKQERKD
ncbi:MAG: TetR/AcrR family transcriptional regulator [Lachnospiraceae bacterium]|nr:TetR/AcrR family transcriptional regulator [Lachnospiraceae bacterium]